jgi:hypothetical protein
MTRFADPPAGEAGSRVEFRCPEPGYSRQGRRCAGHLFAVAVLPLEFAPDGAVLELACQRCRQRLNRNGHPHVARVIHRYHFTGRLIETITEDHGA